MTENVDREKIVVFKIACYEASEEYTRIVHKMHDLYYQNILIERENLTPTDLDYKNYEGAAYDQLSELEKYIYSLD